MSTTPDYKTRDPRGWCGDPTRGAALGRPSYEGDRTFAGKLYLRSVRLDSGGYDTNGTYFGHGSPLFWLASDDGSIDRVFRAADRDLAKEYARDLYPNARFFR